jgi:hypothetical protein
VIDMMDMLSPAVATTLLVIVLVAAGAGFVVMRVLGARAVEGDHPGERGYAGHPRTPHTGAPPTDKELP